MGSYLLNSNGSMGIHLHAKEKNLFFYELALPFCDTSGLRGSNFTPFHVTYDYVFHCTHFYSVSAALLFWCLMMTTSHVLKKKKMPK